MFVLHLLNTEFSLKSSAVFNAAHQTPTPQTAMKWNNVIKYPDYLLSVNYQLEACWYVSPSFSQDWYEKLVLWRKSDLNEVLIHHEVTCLNTYINTFTGEFSKSTYQRHLCTWAEELKSASSLLKEKWSLRAFDQTLHRLWKWNSSSPSQQRCVC